MKICGIDEAGRGSVIGPMVIAGVVIEAERVDELSELGVRDSKLLSSSGREKMFRSIIGIVDAWRAIVLQAREVDSETRRNRGEGINRLEARVFADLINFLKPEVVYIDLPSRNLSEFEEYLRMNLDKFYELVLEFKADEKYPVVSAASIIAKVVRDREIERLHGILGDFGSGYPSDPKTRKFLRESAEKGLLRDIQARLTWKTVDKVLQKRLDEYGESEN